MRLERSISVGVAMVAILAGCRRPVGDTASALDGGAPFEGTVQMSTALDSDVPVVLEIKGARARWNLPGAGGDGSAYRVYDAASRRLFTVLPAQSSVMVDEVPPMLPEGGAAWTFTPIAAPGRVAGYPCARSAASDGARTYELCVARTFPSIPLQFVLPDTTSNVPFLAELQARGETPLAVTAKSVVKGVHIPATPMLTAIEVRSTPMDSARFEVPKFPVTPGHLYAPRALRH
jgi:hypothetical protein